MTESRAKAISKSVNGQKMFQPANSFTIHRVVFIIGKVPKVTVRIINDWIYHYLQAGRGANELATVCPNYSRFITAKDKLTRLLVYLSNQASSASLAALFWRSHWKTAK